MGSLEFFFLDCLFLIVAFNEWIDAMDENKGSMAFSLEREDGFYMQ